MKNLILGFFMILIGSIILTKFLTERDHKCKHRSYWLYIDRNVGDYDHMMMWTPCLEPTPIETNQVIKRLRVGTNGIIYIN